MTLTFVRRAPYVRVLVDGQALPYVFAARATLGLDQDVAEATVICPRGVPAWVRLEGRITILMGANVGTSRQRFTGFVTSFTPNLSSGEFAINARGTLIRAVHQYGEDQSIQGMTDIAAVTMLLTESGIPASSLDISGDGEEIGSASDPDDERYRWGIERSALQMIKEIDRMSGGYRTLDTSSGMVRRKWISSIASDTFAYTFTEGVDLFTGQSQIERRIGPRNQIMVRGWSGVTAEAGVANPTIPSGTSSLFRESRLIDTEAGAQRLADYLLAERNRIVVKFNIQTPRDELLDAGMTVFVAAPIRLELNQSAWVQRIEVVVENESFTQMLTCATDLGLAEENRGTGPGGDDQVISPPVGPTEPPIEIPPELLVDFLIVKVQNERTIATDTAGTIVDVSVEDATVPPDAEVATRLWTASAGASVLTGEGLTFVTSWPEADFATATITLDVTDSLGNVGTITKSVAEAQVSTAKQRKLYAAANAKIEAFDGETWRAGDADPSLVVGNGPLWGHSDVVFRTSDDLATAPTSVIVFPSGVITALWIEPTDPPLLAAAGAATGAFATSPDLGATWVLPSLMPNPGAILRIVTPPEATTPFTVLTEIAIYESEDNGVTWTTLRTRATGQDFQDIAVGAVRAVVASLIAVGSLASPLEVIEGTGTTPEATVPNPPPIGPGPATPEEETWEAEYQQLLGYRGSNGGAFIPYPVEAIDYLTARYGANPFVSTLSQPEMRALELWYAADRIAVEGGATATPYLTGPGESEYLTHRFGPYTDGGGAVAASPFTFPELDPIVSDIRSVFAHPRDDIFACIDHLGRTFVTEEPGGLAMIQAADVPGTIEPGGDGPVYRAGGADPDVPGLLYFAHGSEGVWKSMDFFATVEGYHQLRKATIDGAGDGPWWQVGVGLIGDPVPASGDLIVFNQTEIASWDGTTWTAITPPAGTIVSVAAAPDDGSHLWAKMNNGSAYELYYSNDRGATWLVPMAWPAGVSGFMVQGIQPRGGAEIWISVLGDSTPSSGGVYRSVDAGDSWEHVIPGELSYDASEYGQVAWRIAPLGSDKMVVGQQTTVGGTDHDITITSLDGATRVEVTGGGSFAEPILLYGSSDGAGAWAIGLDGDLELFYIDPVAGTSAIISALAGLEIQNLIVGDGCLVVTEYVPGLDPPVDSVGAIRRSTDGGATWTPVTAVDVAHAATNHSGGADGATRIASGNMYAMLGRQFANHTLWESTDNGVTWTEMAAGYPADPIGMTPYVQGTGSVPT